MRLLLLSAMARFMGIQFHVNGFPYGAPSPKSEMNLSAMSCKPSSYSQTNVSEVP